MTSRIPRSVFDLWLGSLLVLVSAFLLVSGTLRPPLDTVAGSAGVRRSGPRGGALSLIVGFVSGLLGIGGGIIHVPGMVDLLRFPVHLAAGTSHFVLSFTAAAGTIAHLCGGEFHSGFRRTTALSVATVVGAQIGARVSEFTTPAWIIRLRGPDFKYLR